MSNPLLKELSDLKKHGVIDEITASRIEQFYEQNSGSRSNRLLIIFGVLGAFLVGLGIILIVAHNWDSFSKTTRLVFAGIPLLISQIAAIYLVSKKSESVAAREATGAFIVLSVGAVISLVSQIYSIHGDLGKFLFVWTLLAIPVIYVLASSVASMLAWIGATVFVLTAGYDQSVMSPYYYLVLAVLILPHFIGMIRNEAAFNFKFSHHWIVPLSIAIAFSAIDLSEERFLMVSYVGLFGVFLLFSQLNYFSRLKLLINGFLVIGNLGTVYLLLSASFEPSKSFYLGSIDSPLVVIVAFYLGGLFYLLKEQGPRYINPTTWCFPVFVLIFLIGFQSPEISRVLFNLSLLLLAVVIILDGTRKNHLGILNYGLIIISALILCRFFDTNISFVMRGLIFILVGMGFFGFNYWIIKKNKVN